MRWQTVDDGGALFGVDELVGPERGTGRMSDLEFMHVTARRILNHVPSMSRMNFAWTINVYRGCSHACAYCLEGSTPILMADGRVTSISDIAPGDRVYGTVRDGNYRRYVPTTVLDQWRTLKRAYRVTLADGTQLVASGDHRFMSNRGWKHVAPATVGQRPFLTTNNDLLGVGRLAMPPKQDGDYRRGYLCGMIRGDANLATYVYNRPGRDGTVHRFRLALVDNEPLERTKQYLSEFGVETTSFDFSAQTETRKALRAIRTSKLADIERIRALIDWPQSPTDSWRTGFLAGIFDAEGGHNNGVLRIANSDEEILGEILTCCAHFAFTAVREAARENGVATIRIAGGLRERLRFFITVDPATTRKRTIDNVAIKSDADLKVVAIEDTGLDIPMYDITTESGDFIADGVVSHNCFARPTHEYLGLNTGTDFDSKIVVKINAVERLRAELADPAWAGERIAMGTNTDPYQRAEGKYKLTRGVLEVLAEHRNPFSILTKSALVTRDLDVLAQANQVTDVAVNFSIGTLDERVWRATEPGTPHPRRRIDAMRRLAELGVRTGALMAPVLPGLSDSPAQLSETAGAIRDAGGRILGVLPLHLRPGVREHFLGWLAEFDPELHADYLRRYSGRMYAPEHYAERLRAVVRAPDPGAEPV